LAAVLTTNMVTQTLWR